MAMCQQTVRAGLAIVVWAAVLGGGTVLSQPSGSRFVSDPRCERAFEFYHPVDWEVIDEDWEQPCVVRLRPRDFAERMKQEDVDLFTVYVKAETKTFSEAAALNLFERSRGKWIVRGRQGAEGEAQAVSSKRWKGVRGTADVGCFHESGGLAYWCDLYTLVLYDGRGVWSMQGLQDSTRAFDMILGSFRFVRR